MSDEKKPFAEVVPVRLNPGTGLPDAWVLQVGERTVTQGDEKAMQRLADRINAAVDAREAKLMKAAVEMVERHRQRWLDAATHDLQRHGADLTNPDSVFRRDEHQHRCMAGVARDIATDLAKLAPSADDCVPRAELDAVKEKLKGAWGVLADALNEEGGKFSPQAMTLFEALGLKPKPLSPIALPKSWRLDWRSLQRLAQVIGRPVLTADVDVPTAVIPGENPPAAYLALQQAAVFGRGQMLFHLEGGPVGFHTPLVFGSDAQTLRPAVEGERPLFRAVSVDPNGDVIVEVAPEPVLLFDSV